jgi:hypothetical protein
LGIHWGLYYYNVIYFLNAFNNNLLEKGWAKKQPFGKRLGQKTTFWKKVGPKNNLLEKGWAKKQPFGKRLGQKYTSVASKITLRMQCNFKNILARVTPYVFATLFGKKCVVVNKHPASTWPFQ